MKERLSELKALCADSASQSEADLIRTGETTWIEGSPVAAPEGTIALSQGDSVKVIINDADVLDIEEKNGRYSVRVSADSHILVRMDSVRKAGSHARRGDGNQDVSQDVADQGRQRGSFTGRAVTTRVCTTEYQCFTVLGHSVCLPTGTTCKSETKIVID